jgi:type IV pilus assembly protein PilM
MKLFTKLSKRAENRIGIDIGSYAIKIVELSREKDNLRIKNFAYEKVEDPGSKDSLMQAIKRAVDRANILNKEVNIAVAGPSVVVRFVELPRMSENELKAAIPFEAEKYIPFNIEEVVIDHQLLIPRLGEENKMLVLLVAAKKDLINERLSILNEAGLSVGILDVVSCANFNAFLMGRKRKKEEITALIDIGAKETDIDIIDEDALYFTRSIQLGGSDITKVLSDALSMDLNSAENIKINPGKTSEVSAIINPVLNNIIDEIRLSFSYYENQSGKSIEKVYLAGGSSKVINFREMFNENLGIEIVPWDPTEGMELDPTIDAQLITSIKDQLGVAVGLALR